MANNEENTVKNALNSLCNSTQLINRIMHEEIYAFHRNSPKVEPVARQLEKKIRIPLEWFSIILQNEIIGQYYSKMILQIVGLVAKLIVDMNSTTKLWDCFFGLTTFLYHLLAADQYAGILLNSPDAELLCNGFANICEVR